MFSSTDIPETCILIRNSSKRLSICLKNERIYSPKKKELNFDNPQFTYKDTINKSIISNDHARIFINSCIMHSNPSQIFNNQEWNKRFDELLNSTYGIFEGDDTLSFEYVWLPLCYFISKYCTLKNILLKLINNSNFNDSIKVCTIIERFHLHIEDGMWEYVNITNYLQDVLNIIYKVLLYNENFNDTRINTLFDDIKIYEKEVPIDWKEKYKLNYTISTCKKLFDNDNYSDNVDNTSQEYDPSNDFRSFFNDDNCIDNFKDNTPDLYVQYSNGPHYGNGLVLSCKEFEMVTFPIIEKYFDRDEYGLVCKVHHIIYWKNIQNDEITIIPFKYCYCLISNNLLDDPNLVYYELLIVEPLHYKEDFSDIKYIGNLDTKFVHRFSVSGYPSNELIKAIKLLSRQMPTLKINQVVYINPNCDYIINCDKYLENINSDITLNIIPFHIRYDIELFIQDGFIPILWIERIIQLFIFLLERDDLIEELRKIYSQKQYCSFFEEISEEGWKAFIIKYNLSSNESLAKTCYKKLKFAATLTNYHPRAWFASVLDDISTNPGNLLLNIFDGEESHEHYHYRMGTKRSMKTWEDYFIANINTDSQKKHSIFNSNSEITIRSIIVGYDFILRQNIKKELLSNRILRHFHEFSDNFLRVTFINKNRCPNLDEHDHDFASLTLGIGIFLGGKKFEFLLFSNSQLTKGKCWFFAPVFTDKYNLLLGNRILPPLKNIYNINESGIKNYLNISAIRHWLGDFNNKLPAHKWAKYMGLSLSNSKFICDIPKSCIKEIEDIYNDKKAHIFSDGVGKMSFDIAKLVQSKLELPFIPSLIQIRYAGYKGVLAVDPSLSAEKLIFRKSMMKFESDHTYLEVIEVSKYFKFNLTLGIASQLLCLNVPMRTFKERINQYLESTIHSNEIKENDKYYFGYYVSKCKPIKEDQLYSFIMNRYLKKKYLGRRFRLPLQDAGEFLGTMDETGLLKPGEIFLQIRKEDEKPRVIQGNGFVLRNPHPLPNGIRKICLVNIPELSHLVNCVVFPKKGILPIPEMCSSGDLDGDKYIIIWDKDFYPPKELEYKSLAIKTTKNPGQVIDLKLHMVDCFSTNNNVKSSGAQLNYFISGNLLEQANFLISTFNKSINVANVGVPSNYFKAQLADTGHKRYAEQLNIYWKNKSKQIKRPNYNPNIRFKDFDYILHLDAEEDKLFNEIFFEWKQNISLLVSLHNFKDPIQVFYSYECINSLLKNIRECKKKIIKNNINMNNISKKYKTSLYYVIFISSLQIED